MGQYSSYYLYQKYENIGNQGWLPVYPYVYSADGGGTKSPVIKVEDDTACGYVPPEIYRWFNLDPTTDYYCFSCGKIAGTYGTGNTAFSVECNTSTTVTSADTSFSNVITYANIGDCVNEIGPSTFRNQMELTGVTIPNTVDTIGASAFTNCQSMIDCMLPDTVTSIGQAAFSGCVALNSFVLWDTVTSLGASAFTNCDSLVSVNIPSGLTSIPNYCFDDCGALSEITIPNGVTNIGAGAFRNCRGLLNVTIPDNVDNIGNSAFQNCTDLLSITALPDTPPALGASAFTNNNECPIYVKCDSYYLYILNASWSNYGNRIEPIPPCETPPLPSTLKYVGFYDGTTHTVNCNSSSALTSGETRASLPYSGLTRAFVGECVNEIGNRAFYGCKNLNDITFFTDNITSIGSSAFTYCSGLTSVDIPTGVTSIGGGAFWNCNKLTSVTVPDNVTSIGSSAFRNCTGMTSATLGNAVTSIGSNAFTHCDNMQSCNIPSGITTLQSSTFGNCGSLRNIQIPSGVTSINYWTFGSCTALSSCTFEENSQLSSIDELAFFNCSSLKTIDIPDSVETIGEYAFSGSTTLTSVTFGSGITSIGGGGFLDCVSLNHITCKATTPPTIGQSTFRMINQYSQSVKLPINAIQVPCDSVDAYKSAQYWSEYANKIVGDSSCYKFYATYTDSTTYTVDCNSSSELSSGETLGHTTRRVYMLTAVIGDCVTSIGYTALNSATRLTSVTISDSVTSIGGGSFEYCTSLSSITIPSGVTTIGSNAFSVCAISSIIIPSGVTSIGYGAFNGSENLASVTCLATTPPTLGNSVFSGTSPNLVIYVPSSSLNDYKNAYNWSSYASIIQPIA